MVTAAPVASGAGVRGVLFDVDDTLVDTKGAFNHALVGVVGRYLPAGTALDEVTHFWRTDRGGYYRAHTRGEMDHREQRMRRANDLHGEFGGEVLDDDAYEAWDVVFERAFRDGWRAFTDVPACLDALADAGIAFGALSNARFDYQVGKLAAVGLERMPMLVGVDTLGFGKPAPEVFHEGCRRLGLEPHEVAYIGDEADIDAVAATQAGLQGFWLDRVAPEPAAVHGGVEVPRVASLTDFVARMGVDPSGASAPVLKGAQGTLK